MLKFWPNTPNPSSMDSLLTPRASHHEKNPFDTLPQSPHPLLTPTRLSMPYSPFIPLSAYKDQQADLTPGPVQPQTGAASFAASTTSLSLHAPDFTMQAPPPPRNKLSPSSNHSSASSSSSSKATTMGNVFSGSAPSSKEASTPVSRGQIHVKLIQARGLNVRSINARPYVVVQFEQNEFVSRDPTDETDKEVKGTAINLSLSRPSSSNAINALAAVDAAAKRRSGGPSSKDNSPVSSVGSKVSGLSGGLFGRLSAHNPVWKHEVSLCVLHFFYCKTSI